MRKLNLPLFEFKIKKENNNTIIFDQIRKKWIILTPEEWVRQNFISYILDKNYPKSLINCEKVFFINKVTKRYDFVVYDSSGDVEILVECISYDVNLIKEHFDQVMRYNLELKSKYVIVTNGLRHFYFEFDEYEKIYKQKEDLISYKK